MGGCNTMRYEPHVTGKGRKLWYLLIWLEVMISVGFFVRSYFFPAVLRLDHAPGREVDA